VGHLYKIRSGWENEQLAHYLLSRFSFVAHPATVADDLGSDFFCTIFDITGSSPPTLEPRSSFAIQVKSSDGAVEMHNKVGYLQRLEIPFFLGVVGQSPPELKIYTAEQLPFLFAHFGIPQKLWLHPVASETFRPTEAFRGSAEAGAHLNCPHIATFSALEDRSSLEPKVALLNDICIRTGLNIATRRTEEHIYNLGGGMFTIVAGIGSAQHFRNNFYKRLAEVFYNLKWIYENQHDQFRIEEFRVYESLYHGLRSIVPAPGMVWVAYEELKRALGETTSTPRSEEK
jgi:hypothetical protein